MGCSFPGRGVYNRDGVTFRDGVLVYGMGCWKRDGVLLSGMGC